jgi:hypothetical protein
VAQPGAAGWPGPPLLHRQGSSQPRARRIGARGSYRHGQGIPLPAHTYDYGPRRETDCGALGGIRCLAQVSCPSNLVKPSCDRLLTRSFRVQRATAAFLIDASFLVVLVPLDVGDFRPVLARGWHGGFSMPSCAATGTTRPIHLGVQGRLLSQGTARCRGGRYQGRCQSLDHLDRPTLPQCRSIRSVMPVQVGAPLGPGELGSIAVSANSMVARDTEVSWPESPAQGEA